MQKRLIRALGLVVCLSAALAAHANAQTRAQSTERAREAEKAQLTKDVTALTTKAGLNCEIVDVATHGQGQITRDGQKIVVDTYEVACKDLTGYLIDSYKKAPVGDPISCLEAAAVNKQNSAQPACKIRANRTPHYWLSDAAKSKIPGCSLGGGRWISYDATTQKDNIEVACKNAAGGILQMPRATAPDQVTGFHNCLKVANTSLKCELTTAEQSALIFRSLLKSKAPDCTISNGRFVGANDTAEFYEIGCQDKAGFILATKASGEYADMFGCDKAASIGGCQFTDTEALASAAKAKNEADLAKSQATYTSALSKAGVACTFTDARKIGVDRETNREVAEFKCPEAPHGLIAFIPAAGASNFEQLDCFSAALAKMECSFVSKADLNQHLQKLAGNTNAGKGCTVTDTRYGFENAGQVVLEIACADKRGFIGVVNKARSAINPLVPCHVAATNPNVPEKCSLPGNGTNKGA
ncbi:MAG: hypothetical protein QM645_08895 [Asticcacaulis sp.]